MKQRLVYGNGEYTVKRDTLIPRAEAICDTSLKVVDKKDRGVAWTRLFMRTMDRLWLIQRLSDQRDHMSRELRRIERQLEEVTLDVKEAV